MDTSQTEAIRRSKYVVKVFCPETRRVSTSAFESDRRAVWFMERAARQGLTILECRAPCDA